MTTLINALTGILIAKDLFKGTGKKSSTSNKSNGLGLFGKIALTVGGAYLVNRSLKAFGKDQLEEGAGNNTEQGRATNFAILLYDALFPSGQTWVPDGTDEQAVKNIALQIRQQNLNVLVIQSYRTLYNRNLIADLTSEGVYSDYISIINGTASTGGTGGTGGTAPSGTKQLKKEATIYTKGGYNLRDSTGKVIGVTTNGKTYFVVSWKTATYGGTSGTWVTINSGNNIFVQIIISGLYFK